MEIKRGMLVYTGKPHYDEDGFPKNVVVVQDSSKGINPMTGELKRINPSTSIEADKKTYIKIFQFELYNLLQLWDKDEVKNLESQIIKHQDEIKKLNDNLFEVLQEYISIEDCRKVGAIWVDETK